MSGLTTHILDLTHGKPASEVFIQLFFIDQSNEKPIKEGKTDADGRMDEPLLSGTELKVGEYELLFYIGDYFRDKDIKLEEPAFLDKVSVRFGIADENAHYHVPLLVSPWGYQVYRGS